jgi:hypothetical protein
VASRFPVDRHPLSAALFVSAMRATIEGGLRWPPRPACEFALRFGRPGDQVSVEPERLWGRFGELVTVRNNRRSRGIAVRVPDFRSVKQVVEDLCSRVGWPAYHEFIAELRQHARPEDLPPRTNRDQLELLRQQPSLGPLDPIHLIISMVEQSDPDARAEPLIQDWIRCFDRLSSATQEPLVAKLRTAMALGALDLRVADFEVERLPLQYRVNPDLPANRQEEVSQELEQIEVALLIRGAALYVTTQGFMDAFFWEQSVLPTERIGRFLPRGIWPREEPEDAGGEGRLELTDQEVDRDDPRVDPARFDFYTQELGCRRVVEPEGWSGDRNYVAFLLKAASGARFALLDCIERDNAVYVLRIGHPDTGDASEWAAEARRTKWELIRSQGTGRPFVRRFYHSLLWRDRIRSFLENQ